MILLTAHRRRLLIFASVLSLLTYFGFALHLQANSLRAGISTLGFQGVLLVLALSLVNYWLRFWRWHGYLKVLGHQVPIARHWLYYLGGFAFTVSPGKAGEAVRSLYLKRHGVSYAHSLAALFVERVLDVLAIAFLAVCFAGAFAGYQLPALIFGLLIFLGAWLLGRPQLATWLKRKAGRWQGKAQQLGLGTASTLEGAHALLAAPQLFTALLLGIIAWGGEGYGLYVLAKAYSVPLTVSACVAIYALGVLGGALSFFMPGGLGGLEAAMTGLLMAVGKASLSVAAAITLLCRFATLWFAVVLGLLALVLLEILPARSHAFEKRR